MKHLRPKIAGILLAFVGLGLFSSFAPSSAKAGPINNAIDQLNMVAIFCDVNSFASGIPAAGTLSQYLTDERAWYDQSLCQFATKVLDKNNPNEIFGERYTYAQLNWIINSIFTSFLQGINNLFIAYLKTFVPAFAQSTPSYPTNRLSFIGEMHRTLEKFDLATPANAQTGGFGFQTSEGLRELWGASKNLALLLMVLALLAVGFMVMFRVKINPQTAVSIQLIIPRLIIALVGIIASYALAGLIIDLIYGVISVIIYMSPSNIFANPNDKISAIKFFTQADFFGMLAYFMAGIMPVLIIFGATFPPLAIIIGFLYFLLVGKLFWKLLSAYFMFIIQVIIGPWQIMLGIVPGSKGGYLGGIGSWFRTTLGHASTFIIIPLLIFLNQIFWNNGGGVGGANGITSLLQQVGTVTSTPMTPGIIGVSMTTFPAMPLMAPQGAILGTLFGFFVGLAALAMAPKFADNMREKISGDKSAGYESAIGQAIGSAIASNTLLQGNLPVGGKTPNTRDWIQNAGVAIGQAVSGRTPAKVNQPQGIKTS